MVTTGRSSIHANPRARICRPLQDTARRKKNSHGTARLHFHGPLSGLAGKYQVFRCIPTVYEDGMKRKLNVMHDSTEQFFYVIHLGFSVALRIINAVIDHPGLASLGINVHAVDQAVPLMRPCAVPLYCNRTSSILCEKFLSSTVSSNTIVQCGEDAICDRTFSQTRRTVRRSFRR